MNPMSCFSLRSRTLLGCLALLTSPVWATPCMYLGADADTRVINRSGEISTPYPTAIAANDCTRLRVATGSVKVYVLNARVSGSSVNQVTRGPLLPANVADAPVGADSAGILKQIMLVLEGVDRVKAGSSRGGEADYLLASLPTGKLAEPAQDLVLELSPVTDQNLTTFELLLNGKSQYRQSGPAKVLRLPVAALKPGNTLNWKLDYAGKKYQGNFTVEPKASMETLVQSVPAPQGTANDTLAQALQTAGLLAQEGYGWDAREVIRRALAQ